jgi:outer membrane receptor protein involved in Fe transport
MVAASIGTPSPARSQIREDADTARASRPPLRSRTDTTGTDSLFRLFVPPRFGTLDPALDSTLFIPRSDFPWLDHRSVADLLQYRPGFVLHDQTSIGQYTSPTIDGVDWRGIAFLWNGRPLTDPATGIFNPSMAAPGTLERIEVITGPRAFLYGMNAAGAAVNLVTRNYNSNRPYTKIEYSESGYGYAQSEGTYAQNVTRRMNVTAGFQFQGTDGRFLNSFHEAWNIWGKIRYGLSERLTVTLSDYFSSTNTGLNGGVDPALSRLAFDPIQATVVNPDSYEKITRHDLDLTAVGSFLPDSAGITTLTLYSSFDLREYRDEEGSPTLNGRTVQLTNGVVLRSDHRSSWMGAHFTQTLALPLNNFLLGADAELLQVIGSPNIGRRRRMVGSIWAKDEIDVGPALRLAVYGRADDDLGLSRPGIGADARLALHSSLSLFGGLSVSSRVPNFVESYWTDSTVSRNGELRAERHTVGEAGLEWTPGERTSIRLTLSHRRISDAILILPLNQVSIFPSMLFTNGGTVNITDADLSVSLHVWHLQLEGTGTFFLDRTGGTAAGDLPRLWLYGGFYIRDEFFNGSLDIKAGVRGWYRSANRGMLFNPEVLAYVPNNTTAGLGQASTVDFVLEAHLGDASIHLIWENLPSISYYATPYFPGLDREVRFGVAWEFWN